MNNSCTTTMADLREAYVLSRTRDGLRTEDVIAAARADANRAIAAHDAELGEQIAREIEETLPLDLTSFHAEGQYVGISSAARIARGKEQA